jgi:hypothetical protein
MRLGLLLFPALTFVLGHDATGQVLGYGAQGADGYGNQSLTSRTAKLTKDTAYQTLMPNEIWSTQPWKDSVYIFKEFQYGCIEHNDGTIQKSKWKMNYNYFLDNIDVQLESGGTVGLARYPDLKTVYIGNRKFRYEQTMGFVECFLSTIATG